METNLTKWLYAWVFYIKIHFPTVGITVLYRVEEMDREVFTMCGYFLKIAEALH